MRSPVLRLVLFVVLGGIWAAAAWSLWDSVVPGNLSLPDVRIDGIPQEILDRADRYERFFRIEFVLSQLVLIGVLILYAKHGARFAKESAAGRIGTGMLLGMIGLAFVWLSQVPFRLAEVWWDRRYDQTDSGYFETLFANWFQLGAEFLFICFALVVVMALAGGSRAAGGSQRRRSSSGSPSCSASSTRTSPPPSRCAAPTCSQPGASTRRSRGSIRFP